MYESDAEYKMRVMKVPRCVGCHTKSPAFKSLADRVMWVTFEQRDGRSKRTQKRSITVADIDNVLEVVEEDAREFIEESSVSTIVRNGELCLKALASCDLEAIATCATNRLSGNCVEYMLPRDQK